MADQFSDSTSRDREDGIALRNKKRIVNCVGAASRARLSAYRIDKGWLLLVEDSNVF